MKQPNTKCKQCHVRHKCHDREGTVKGCCMGTFKGSRCTGCSTYQDCKLHTKAKQAVIITTEAD